MRYYIADCHFFHDSLNRQMDCRGFANAEEMNNYMIAQWNKKVRWNDEVIILGDFSLGKADETNRVLEQLNGILCLIEGNHDQFGHKKGYNAARFKWIRSSTTTSARWSSATIRSFATTDSTCGRKMASRAPICSTAMSTTPGTSA